jgi:hypothetical protein
MRAGVETFERATELPAEWDGLCGDNYAMRRSFLALLERGNPCDQRYHLFRDRGGRLDSILVTYRLRRMNLFMLTPSLTWNVDATLVHVPVSITRPGFILGEATRREAEAFLRGIKGYLVVLNLDSARAISGFALTRTCARLAVEVRWPSFPAYLASMRNHYRYYFRRAMKAASALSYRMLEDNRLFDERLYALYEQVHEDSRIRLEKLGIEYFRSDAWKIFVYELEGEPLGFIQLYENGDELVFEFIGMDYRHNRAYSVYANLLLKIMEYGIEGGFRTIELGQTTEEMKLRLGAGYQTLYALLRHSSPLLNGLLSAFRNLIAYKPFPDRFNLFKEEGA